MICLALHCSKRHSLKKLITMSHNNRKLLRDLEKKDHDIFQSTVIPHNTIQIHVCHEAIVSLSYIITFTPAELTCAMFNFDLKLVILSEDCKLSNRKSKRGVLTADTRNSC